MGGGGDTMEIHIIESTVIRPAQETPKHCIRISDLDILMLTCHVPGVYFFRRPDDSCRFFETDLLKEALSNVLVPFYPVAGRFSKDENGRFEIKCNGEGVLFLEAETSIFLDDFTDFEQSFKLMQLFPNVDHTKDASFYPLFMAQVTHFKCGAVCLGFITHHMLMDGTTICHFINSWAEMTRGVPISIPPNFDRACLEVGVPNCPAFNHIEYDPPPTMNDPAKKLETNLSTGILKLSLDQMNTLKEKSKKDKGSTVKYTKFEILAAHIWRCACKARGLLVDQASKINIPTSGRFKLNPKIPDGYCGNACFSTTPIAKSGDIQSESLNYTTERIHRTLKQVDDKYMKSALAYLKQQPDLTILKQDGRIINCPNLMITKLADMPYFDANFGWGRPVFIRLVADLDGMVCILSSPANDGSWLVVIDLETNHLQLFKKFFFDIFS